MKMYQFDQLIGVIHFLFAIVLLDSFMSIFLMCIGLFWFIMATLTFRWEMKHEWRKFRIEMSDSLRDTKRYYKLLNRVEVLIALTLPKDKKLLKQVEKTIKESDAKLDEAFSMKEIFGKKKKGMDKEKTDATKKIPKKHNKHK